MNRNEKIDYIIDYFNQHYRFQKFVYGWELDERKVSQMTDEELDSFIEQLKKEMK